jgi:acetyl esterase/lipase
MIPFKIINFNHMKIICFLLMIGFLQPVYGQIREVIELWPEYVPGEDKPKSEPEISDNVSGNVVRIAEVTNPVLEVFKAENPTGASVIVCPGGGYNILAIDLEGYEIAQWLNNSGITAFVLQYRVPQKQEGALQDIQRAIRLVRKNSEKWSLDPGKIGVIGFSAGGSLAARAGTRFKEKTYDNIDEADQYSARPDYCLLIYPAYLDKGPGNTLTPELTVTEETPPVYIFGTADDKHANSCLVMTQSLRNNKVPVELHIMPEGGHGYGLRKGKEAAELWPALAKKWLMKMIF